MAEPGRQDSSNSSSSSPEQPHEAAGAPANAPPPPQGPAPGARQYPLYQELELAVHGGMTTEEMQNELGRQLLIPENLQRTVLKDGDYMVPGRTLAEQGVHQGSEVHVVLLHNRQYTRGRGGRGRGGGRGGRGRGRRAERPPTEDEASDEGPSSEDPGAAPSAQ
eukprot:m51a1_g10689 hypothetical protein (164) ;mRNA; r:127290-127854